MSLKVEHIVLIILAFIAAVGGCVATQFPGTAWATYALTTVGLVTSLRSLFALPPLNPVALKAAVARSLGVWTMFVACLGLVTAPMACTLTPAQKSALVVESEQAGATIAACVLNQAVSGVTSAAQIAVTCGVPAAINVAEIVASLLQGFQGPADAGVVVALAANSPRALIIAALKAVH